MRTEREAPAAAAAHIIEGDFMNPDQRETVALCLEEMSIAFRVTGDYVAADRIECRARELREAVRPSPSPEGGTLELYANVIDHCGVNIGFQRIPEAMAVIEAARRVVEDQGRIHDKSAWPQKYRAAFGAIAKLFDALSALDNRRAG